MDVDVVLVALCLEDVDLDDFDLRTMDVFLVADFGLRTLGLLLLMDCLCFLCGEASGNER